MISDFQNQINGFLLSVFFGVFLSVLYDILKITRKFTSPKRIVVFVLDFFFLSFCGIVTFIAAFSTNYGVLRAYHILGEAVGVIIYFISLGKITEIIAGKVVNALVKTKAFVINKSKKIQKQFTDKKKTKKCRKKGAKSLKKVK